MRVVRALTLSLAMIVVPTMLSAQTYPSKTDPRNNLKPGRFDAGEAHSVSDQTHHQHRGGETRPEAKHRSILNV
jgi:hypothetical protein